MAARIRKGDRVEVISGAEKGKRGDVLSVSPKADRAVVQGVNLATKHTKPRSVSQPGGIVEQEASIHLSNLMLVHPTTDKATRIGYRVLDNGSKVRFAKSGGQAFES